MSVLRKPDFELHALIKGTKTAGKLGVGWITEDGKSISIKFDHFADLNAARGPDVVVTLFDRRKPQES